MSNPNLVYIWDEDLNWIFALKKYQYQENNGMVTTTFKVKTVTGWQTIREKELLELVDNIKALVTDE